MKETSKEKIKRLRESGKKWREIGDEFPELALGTLCRFYKDDYDPKAPSIRRALGLPEFVTVVACSRCGAIHDQLKTCPSKRKPRRLRRRWVPPLLAAIRAAYRRMTDEEVEELRRKT